LIPGTEDPKAQWPPVWMDPILHRIETWAAWHSGDPDKLAAVYTGSETDTSGFFASETGGFKARVKRFVSNVVRYFWGQRTNGRPRRRLHDPIAGDIASASADLLFAEPVVAKAVDEKGEPVEAAQVVLDAIMDASQATLLEGGETCAALSGVYLRARWDDETERKQWFDVVGPDCAVPYWRAGELDAVTLWRVVARKGSNVFRHLEHHSKGETEHGLFKGSDETIGISVPLTELPGLTGIASEVDENNIVKGKSQRLAVRYVPNMRPNRIWRDIPQAAYLGVSDFSGVELLMDALDLAYSSLMRDVDLGKARLVVPRSYMNDHGRGEGASFDLDRELYEPVNAMADEDKGMQLEMVQFDIRYEEHEAVINRLKTDAIVSAGYSPQTFGLEGDVAITATEVAAKARRSLTTRARKICYWDPELSATLTTLLEMAGHAGVKVVLEWPDAVAPDPKMESEKVLNWESAKAASIETKVKELHPDWEQEAVDEEVKLIKEENQVGAAEDPGSFTGGSFGAEGTDQKVPPEEEPEGPEGEA